MLRVSPPAVTWHQRLERCYSIDDLGDLARRRLPSGAWAYLQGGSEDEHTLHRNREALAGIELVPDAVSKQVAHVDTSLSLLGQHLPLPFVFAPVGGARLFHHQGELAVARAAQRAGLPYAISSLGTVPVEDIAATTDTPLWFQLDVWGDRAASRRAVTRAKEAGFSTLLLDIDTSVRSKREREKRAGLALPNPRLAPSTLLDGVLHPSWSWHFLASDPISFPNIGPADERSRKEVEAMFDGSVTWRDLEWIRDMWDGPIVAKGVIDLEEVHRAADAGVDGLVVSNHGGRQLDHVPATIEVLADIVEAVGDRLTVLFDSGIRRGTDALAALALGADAVLLGRAHLFGLAAAGEAGVSRSVDILAEELRTAMALCGASSLADLRPSLVRRQFSSSARG